MRGWKVTRAADSGNFLSMRARVPTYARNYRIGLTVTEMAAPLFFFGDDLTAEDLLTWGLHPEIEIALLRVEAAEPVRAMARCADEEADFPAFWELVLANGEWPREKSFACPAKTFVSTSIRALAFVWQGRRTGDTAALLAEIRAAMSAAREPVQDRPVGFFPVVRA